MGAQVTRMGRMMRREEDRLVLVMVDGMGEGYRKTLWMILWSYFWRTKETEPGASVHDDSACKK